MPIKYDDVPEPTASGRSRGGRSSNPGRRNQASPGVRAPAACDCLFAGHLCLPAGTVTLPGAAPMRGGGSTWIQCQQEADCAASVHPLPPSLEASACTAGVDALAVHWREP